MANELITQSALRALDDAIKTWADVSTSPESQRRADLKRDKYRVVTGFIGYVKKHPAEAGPGDVVAWREYLEDQGLTYSTIYNYLCQVSSFYNWARKTPGGKGVFPINPVDAVRPKAPKQYQGVSGKRLRPNQIKAISSVIRSKVTEGDIPAMRDYALWLVFLSTGLRREEVIGLCWQDFDLDGKTTYLKATVKGGEQETVAVKSKKPGRAILNYLEASGRLETIEDEDPLWVRHDQGAPDTITPLSSHAFASNMKRYAKEAGVTGFHLHRTRHTVADWINQRDGIHAAQQRLGHKRSSTTRLYVSQLSTRRDAYSDEMLDEFGA